MRNLLFLFVLAFASSAISQNTYQPNPQAYNQPRYGPNLYSGWINSDSPNGTTLGNAIYTATSSTQTVIYTIPATTTKKTWVLLRANSTLYNVATDTKTAWITTEVIGSGVLSKKGTFAMINGVNTPVDSTGAPVDIVTGEPAPANNTADFILDNPMGQAAGFSYDIVITPLNGDDPYTMPVYLGPGESRPIHLASDGPFTYAVYPIIEGQRGTPGAGASGGGSSSFSGSGIIPSGPTVVQGPGINTSPTSPAPAPADNVQAEIARLSGIIQVNNLAQQTRDNLGNEYLSFMRVRADEAAFQLKLILAGITGGVVTSQAEIAVLQSIKSSVDRGILEHDNNPIDLTATNSLLSAIKGQGEVSGDAGQAPAPGSDSAARSVIEGGITMRSALTGLRQAFGIGEVGGNSALSWNIPLVYGWSGFVTLEPFSGSIAIARSIGLYMGAYYFLLASLLKIRGAFV